MALILARALADPASALELDARGWTALLTIARAEALLGALAVRLDGLPVPPAAAGVLADGLAAAEADRRAMLWEAEMARRALGGSGITPVLLKGTAYVAAGLSAGRGRMIGDLDLLVPAERLADAEAALLAAGWEPVKDDACDDAYHRRRMHELPPLINRERDRMADVRHTILPSTARIRPHAAALPAAAVPLGRGLAALSSEDMVAHAAAHLLADGDLSGGLRDLWDIDRLCREFDDARDWWHRLDERAARHPLAVPVARAIRLAHHLFTTPAPERLRRLAPGDRLFRRRLLARDGWGRPTRPVTRAAFCVRSHWLRMPPPLLARRLLLKARRRRSAPARG